MMIASGRGVSFARAQPAQPVFERSAAMLPSFLAPRKQAARPPDSRSPAEPPPIAFFVASGPANVCGPGCDGWIAAEGKIDLNAAQRLRRLLARLGSRKLPLFLHSAGGSVIGAIELGRLVRSHNLTVSVARTLPGACLHDDPQDKACEALKRSGQDVVAELDSAGAMCNSACVLVLAGGSQRTVPPGVRLGVHAIGVDTSKTAIRGPLLAAVTRSANARIVEFLHDMGIPRALFEVSNAVPHESSRFLGRDELVRFALDTREFGETDWRFGDRPVVGIAKGFFMHTADPDIAYPEALLRLNCGAEKSMRLTFVREHPASAAGTGTQPIRLAVSGRHIDLLYTTQVGKIELYSAALSPDIMVSAGDNATIELSGLDLSGAKTHDGKNPDGNPRDRVVLTMTGFSSAFARLRKVCTETASADNGCRSGDLSPRCRPDSTRSPPASAAAGGAASGQVQ